MKDWERHNIVCMSFELTMICSLEKISEDRTVDIVTIHNLKKYFGKDFRQVKTLDGINLSIEKGKFTAIVGASGSGKTTLLNTIGGLYEPTEGEVFVDGINLAELEEEQCTAIARAVITKPAVILAHELTGSFDAKTSQNVLGLLKMTTETFHQTLIMITRNLELGVSI